MNVELEVSVLRWTTIICILFLLGPLYSTGMWFDVTSKRHAFQEIGLCAQNMTTILGSTINTIGETYMII